MSLFICDNCGNIENTATSFYNVRKPGEVALCYPCDPKGGGKLISKRVRYEDLSDEEQRRVLNPPTPHDVQEDQE